MARKRVVSPELLTSETVASLPIPTRYAWVALWMYVDDEGRGRDNVALIRAHTWPLDDGYTPRKVAADLDRMAERGLICRYIAGSERLLHLPTWSRWQKVSHPSPSRLPMCPLEASGDPHEVLVSAWPDSLTSPNGSNPPESLASRSGDSLRNVVKGNSIEVKGPECEHGIPAPEALKRCPLCRQARMRVVTA